MRSLLLSHLVLLPLALTIHAQPAPRVDAISAPWVQRGTASEISLTGNNLANAKSISVSGDAGVEASLLRPSKPGVGVEVASGGISTFTPSDPKKLMARLVIATNAPLGAREVRVVTPWGVSNPLTLNISSFPEVSENDDSKSLEKAQLISLPVAVSGVISSTAQSDFYRFKGMKGEHVIVEIMSARMGTALDSSLAILDGAGKELARNEDANNLDSLIDFEVPANGEYVIQLRDFRHLGGSDFKYRLMAGVAPYVLSTYPLGGARGKDVSIALKGQNLDGTSELSLHLEPAAALGRQEIRASTSKGLSNPFPFDVTDLPEFNESEPNTALDQADRVTLPFVINGRIGQSKDWDAFKFRAEQDQEFVFEIIASRFGSPLDALLTLTDDRGNMLQRNDDALGADARITHKFKATGDYILIVEDLLERGGDNYAYRLSAKSPKPDFSLTFTPDTPRVHREGFVPIRVELTRLNGFGGIVRVSLADLPPGLYAESLLLSPEGPGNGTILLTATKDAALGSVPLKLVATGTIGGKAISKRVQPLGIATPPSTTDKPVRAAYLTILEEAPFRVEPLTLATTIEQDRTGEVELVIERSEGFMGDITISAEGFSTGKDPITKSFDMTAATVKAGSSRGTIKLKARTDSEIGTRPIILKAEAKVNGQTISTYSSSIPITTTQIPFVVTPSLKRLAVTALPPGSQSAASEAVFIVKADRRAGFDGEISLVLDGVPEGITATIDKIAANSNEATLKLVATDKAPAGKDRTLTLSGAGQFKDRNYRYQSAPLTLTINAPEAMEVKTAQSETPATSAVK